MIGSMEVWEYYYYYDHHHYYYRHCYYYYYYYYYYYHYYYYHNNNADIMIFCVPNTILSGETFQEVREREGGTERGG